LKQRDRAILDSGDMVNDLIVNAAQKLIQSSFPMVGGLQDTIKSQTEFDSCSCENAVQIHHTGNCHWVTSAAVGTRYVTLYDSRYRKVTESIKVQLAQCYQELVDGMGNLNVDIPPVQQQKSGKDCGLFAVAFAVEAASGTENKKVGNVKFDQSKMRSHLIQCIEQGRITAFPRQLPSQKATVSKHHKDTIKTLSCCNLPKEYAEVIQCDMCDELFHLKCLSLEPQVELEDWMCPACVPPIKRKKII